MQGSGDAVAAVPAVAVVSADPSFSAVAGVRADPGIPALVGSALVGFPALVSVHACCC